MLLVEINNSLITRGNKPHSVIVLKFRRIFLHNQARRSVDLTFSQYLCSAINKSLWFVWRELSLKSDAHAVVINPETMHSRCMNLSIDQVQCWNNFHSAEIFPRRRRASTVSNCASHCVRQQKSAAIDGEVVFVWLREKRTKPRFS